jgi:hypothetical protein
LSPPPHAGRIIAFPTTVPSGETVNRLAHVLCLSVLALPGLALAQAAALPGFPPEAQPVAPDVLREKLLGKSFVAKAANGVEMRLQYKSDFVYLNAGPTNDSGRWRTEGSQMCIEWNRIPNSGCSEARLVGNTIYITRVSNGEVMRLEER